MTAVGWIRALLAALGFLVALLSLRHSVDIYTQNRGRRHGEPGVPVDWSGVAGFALLTIATSITLLVDIKKPFQGITVLYGVAYLLAGWSLTRAYRIPVVERLVQWLARRRARASD